MYMALQWRTLPTRLPRAKNVPLRQHDRLLQRLIMAKKKMARETRKTVKSTATRNKPTTKQTQFTVKQPNPRQNKLNLRRRGIFKIWNGE